MLEEPIQGTIDSEVPSGLGSEFETNPIDESQNITTIENEENTKSLSEDEEESPSAQSFIFTISEATKKPKEGITLSYWVYNIKVQTTLEKFKEKEFNVWRRFSDFDGEHLGLIIPPIPEKDIFGSLEKIYEFDNSSLLEYRQRALSKFLFRIGDHSILQKSVHLEHFLLTNDKKFNEIKSQKIVTKYTLPSSIGSFFRSNKSKEDEFITQTKEFLFKLEELLKQLKYKLENMIKGREELSISMKEFGISFNNLSILESSFDQNDYSKNLKKIYLKSEEISEIMKDQGKKQSMHIIETLQYYQGMITSIHRSINIINSLRLNRDDHLDLIENSKKSKSDPEIEKLIFHSKNMYKEAMENFMVDYEKFGAERSLDFKVMIDQFISLELDYSSNLEMTWSSLIDSIEK